MKEKIGSNAGLVWNVLTGQPAKSLKDVKKQTKLTEKDLYAALGWLSREDKLIFSENADGDIFVEVI
ncbi:MAG: winged helix-turn-helix domain-containing protein [Dysgonamonadaceae bacterium]|nr:winged helix-turn-helix domain-containing protein [Dysgonamonadaceae bacterium]